MDNRFYCEPKNDPNITTPSQTLILANTEPLYGNRSDSEIRVVQFTLKTVHYFPSIAFFPKLEGFSIQHCHLKEVNQADLRQYPHLELLWLIGNDIEVLEEGLFDHNDELGYINLGGNKLSYVDSKIFNQLPILKNLCLNSNPCIHAQAYKSETKVAEIRKELEIKCKDSDYLDLKKLLSSIERDLETFGLVNALKIDENIQKAQDSKFSKLTSIKEQLKELSKTRRQAELKLTQQTDESVQNSTGTNLETLTSSKIGKLTAVDQLDLSMTETTKAHEKANENKKSSSDIRVYMYVLSSIFGAVCLVVIFLKLSKNTVRNVEHESVKFETNRGENE